jgi:hypothetical protein
MYERGLQALQRRDFAAAAEALRNVIARYPDERVLLERARLCQHGGPPGCYSFLRHFPLDCHV